VEKMGKLNKVNSCWNFDIRPDIRPDNPAGYPACRISGTSLVATLP